MLIHALLFVGGMVALTFGAEWLVRGAGRIARAAGISPLVVGLTIVAFGTSTPELVVSTVAAGRGQGDVATGNVIGSNIVNITLILGLAAMVCPIPVDRGIILREMPIMLVAIGALALLALDGTVGRADGLVLVAGFVAYVVFVIRTARRASTAPELNAEYKEHEQAHGMEPAGTSKAWNVFLVLAGLVGLVLGGEALVRAAVFFARAAGVSELLIGLTVVAVGTSLPELATSVIAAVRKEVDIAMGNVVGSNIFNVLGVLGVAALVAPVRVDPALYRFEIPVVLVLSILLPVLARSGMRVGRVEGLLLVAGYVAFTVALVVRST
jgi:cation:H+ antiporter